MSVIERLRAVLAPVDDGWDLWLPVPPSKARIMAYEPPTFRAVFLARVQSAGAAFSLSHAIRRAGPIIHGVSYAIGLSAPEMALLKKGKP